MVTDRRIQEYWDADAAICDRSGHHHFRSAAERAAWSAFMVDALPAVPVRVLDVGAGTGFLSIIAAELGHQVTALDVSASMLSELRKKGSSRLSGVNARGVPSCSCRCRAGRGAGSWRSGGSRGPRA